MMRSYEKRVGQAEQAFPPASGVSTFLDEKPPTCRQVQVEIGQAFRLMKKPPTCRQVQVEIGQAFRLMKKPQTCKASTGSACPGPGMARPRWRSAMRCEGRRSRLPFFGASPKFFTRTPPPGRPSFREPGSETEHASQTRLE
jgi:hypothetical protein